MVAPNQNKPGGKAIIAIAIFKFIKGALFIALTIGALGMLDKDVEAIVSHWVDLLRIDPDNRHVAALLAKLDLVDDHKLKQLSFLTGIYGALFLTEGTGLALRKRWAEYLTLIATGLFIPIELYEIFRAPSLMKFLLLGVNVAVLVFLFILVRRNGKNHTPNSARRSESLLER